MIFQKTLDAMMIIEIKTGNILVANQAAYDIFGYEKEALEGKHYSMLFPEDTDVPGLEEENGVVHYDAVFVQTFQCADGTCKQMDLTLTMIPWQLHSAILTTFRDASNRINAEQEREKLISELQSAMEKIKTLRGLLPICAHCKKVRDDEGYWQQVEVYVRDHSLAEFSHGICPECLNTHYKDLMDEEN
jgi:PAS domain S-box-containing protein